MTCVVHEFDGFRRTIRLVTYRHDNSYHPHRLGRHAKEDEREEHVDQGQAREPKGVEAAAPGVKSRRRRESRDQ